MFHHSDFVANNAALADTFTDKEPESNLSSDEGVQPGILKWPINKSNTEYER